MKIYSKRKRKRKKILFFKRKESFRSGFALLLSLAVFLYPFLFPLLKAGASEEINPKVDEEVTADKTSQENEEETEGEVADEETEEEEAEEKEPAVDEKVEEADVDSGEDDEEDLVQEAVEETREAEGVQESEDNVQKDASGELPEETPVASVTIESEVSSETVEEDLSQEEDPFWKSCDLNEEESQRMEESDFEKCGKMDRCEDVKECMESEIFNENEARVKNEIEQEVNTGENRLDVEKEEGDVPSDDSCEEKVEEEKNSSDADDSSQDDVEDEEFAEDEKSEAPTELKTDSVDLISNDAVVEVDIFNDVNTNIVGENFLESVENIYGREERDINLLEKFQSLLDKANSVEESDGEMKVLNIENENLATLENNVDTEANSGKNEIFSEVDVAVETGDALNDVDIVNMANRNLIGKNWLFEVINVFGEWVGDLIVPGEGVLSVSNSGYEVSSVENDNRAKIYDNLDVEANSGENKVKSYEDGEVFVETGQSATETEVLNILNTNIVKDNWFFLLINNMGSWTGQIVGWDGDENQNSFGYDFAVEEGDESLLNTILNVVNRNEAYAWNNVTAQANTGENVIYGDGDVNLKTGNANS